MINILYEIIKMLHEKMLNDEDSLIKSSQLTFNCSKPTIETVEKGVKLVQN